MQQKEHKASYQTTGQPDANLLLQLKELADTPFTLRGFRDRWQRFGWVHEPHADDRFGFSVRIDSERSLRVGPFGGDVLCAFHAFAWWEDYDPHFHKEPAEYEQQRAAYDAAFDAAVEIARRVLPPPLAEWTDADRDAHRAVVWSGTHGLLVLQQAALDIQFGWDLDLWLSPCLSEQFRPTTPLCDWLYSVSDRKPDSHGLPSLMW